MSPKLNELYKFKSSTIGIDLLMLSYRQQEAINPTSTVLNLTHCLLYCRKNILYSGNTDFSPSKPNTKSKFPDKQIFIISKEGILTNSNQAHALLYFKINLS